MAKPMQSLGNLDDAHPHGQPHAREGGAPTSIAARAGKGDAHQIRDEKNDRALVSRARDALTRLVGLELGDALADHLWDHRRRQQNFQNHPAARRIGAAGMHTPADGSTGGAIAPNAPTQLARGFLALTDGPAGPLRRIPPPGLEANNEREA
jgi:hypothetical protein